MERKNTVLLTVIAVATLLVAVVGATFAYFTATNTTTKKDATTSVTTQDKVGGTTFNFAQLGTDGKDYMKYPGGVAVVAASANLKESAESDADNYTALYNLKIKYTNQTKTVLNWSLYKSDQKYTNLDPACVLASKATGSDNKTAYWYNNDGGTSTDSCNLTNAEQLKSLSEEVAKGTFLVGQTDQEITATQSSEGELDKNTNKLSGFELTTSNSSGTDENGVSEYYYLVVTFPNLDSQQDGLDSGNTGKEISVTLSLEADPVTAPVSSGP